jgi:transcriptional regulator with XRE-family HTH domain
MNRVKILREEFGYTQQELADKLDGAKSTIAMYENETRKPSLEVLIKLSEIFNCSIDYILCKSDVRNPEEIKNVQFANAGGLDTTDLDEDDLEELQRQIDYIKKMKRSNNHD